MCPILRDGDLIEHIHVSSSQIKVNDIVLLLEGDGLITHRAIYFSGHFIVTRGDNNKQADKKIARNTIFAKVTRFKRKKTWYKIQDIYRIQSAAYLHEIRLLSSLFSSHHIPHVFIKGVLVSLKYENRIPQRVYSDCDILVAEREKKRVEQVFIKLKYYPFGKQTGPEISYIKMVGKLPVVFDLHFEPVFLMTRGYILNGIYRQDLLLSLGDHFLKRSKKHLLHPIDQVLYLALHIFHHNFTDIIRYQLFDAVIRKTIKKHPTFWKELGDLVVRYHLQGYLLGVFLRYQVYFPTLLPRFFSQKISPSWFALRVIRFALSHTNVFSEDIRLRARIIRLLLVLLLSSWK